MDKLIPCRKMFTETLELLAKRDSEIMVVTSDARGSVTLDSFAENLKDQFIEVGIAEQNSIGIAAGLSTFGKKVFYCSPASFLTSRGFEQIKVDVGYADSRVRLIGVSGGVSYGALGLTHHTVNDIAMIRSTPNVDVVLPCDRWQTKRLTEYMTGEIERPLYVRVGRNAVPDVYTEKTAVFEYGKANTLLDGTDITIIAAGETVYYAYQAGLQLEKQGIKARVLDMHTVKPIDRETVIKAAQDTNHILTVEEHSIYGGLGSSVAEVIAQEAPCKMQIVGLPDEPPIAGKPLELFAYYGLDEKGIVKSALKMLK